MLPGLLPPRGVLISAVVGGGKCCVILKCKQLYERSDIYLKPGPAFTAPFVQILPLLNCSIPFPFCLFLTW